MRSLLAAAAVAAVAFVPPAQAAPADCLQPLIGANYPAPEPVTRDDQGRIIVNPSAFDPEIQRVVTAVLCLT